MTIDVEKKEIRAVALTPIVQQTAFWAEVKSYQGIESKAFDFKVKNSEVYVDDLTKTSTYADLLILQQALNKDTSIAYVPYGPELEPSEEDEPQGGSTFLIAAMRCYVASKLGDTVEIPEELL